MDISLFILFVVDSQAKVHMLKNSLQVCKTQLRCKREELKRLWLDEVKYKKMLKLIDEMWVKSLYQFSC